MIPVGMSAYVQAARVLAVVSIEPLPSRQMYRAAKVEGLLIDATRGRAGKSLLILDTGRVIVSMLNADTIAGRMK